MQPAHCYRIASGEYLIQRHSPLLPSPYWPYLPSLLVSRSSCSSTYKSSGASEETCGMLTLRTEQRSYSLNVGDSLWEDSTSRCKPHDVQSSHAGRSEMAQFSIIFDAPRGVVFRTLATVVGERISVVFLSASFARSRASSGFPIIARARSKVSSSAIARSRSKADMVISSPFG